MKLQGRKIFSGKVEGEALVSQMGISFYGGVDPDTGVILEKGHDLEGQSIAGKVLVFPSGKGSTVGSYTLYPPQSQRHGPCSHGQCRDRDHHCRGLHHFRNSLRGPDRDR